MELEIDFSGVEDLNSMHEILKESFGFPDFYGKNVNALIDCWTSLRFPEDGMTMITLDKEEVLLLRVKSFPLNKCILINHFLVAVQAVNERYITREANAPINLLFV